MNVYYPYSEYLKSRYGGKVYKLPINLPVSCPNRIGGPGCAFCAGAGTGFEAMDNRCSVTEQLEETKKKISAKYHPEKYIAYFQNYTNTFLPVEQFASYMAEAAKKPYITEIAVSTRPDCIRKEYLDVLERIRCEKGIGICLELGLQTANYHTLNRLDRGHGLAEFLDAVLQIKKYPEFTICVHVILNLPWDTVEDTLETAKVLTVMQVDCVKLHSLYIAKNTRLCDWFEDGKITVCSKEEYFRRVILFLEHIPKSVAVERLFSRVPEKDSVFCNWGESWWKLRDQLLEQMEENGNYQGRCVDYLEGPALRRLSQV